jgi:hypothetical protein
MPLSHDGFTKKNYRMMDNIDQVADERIMHWRTFGWANMGHGLPTKMKVYCYLLQNFRISEMRN